MTRRNAKPRRRPSAHARRPGIALRRRVGNAMPRPGRIAAGLLAAVLIGGLIGSTLGSGRLDPKYVRILTALLILYVAARLAIRFYGAMMGA